MVGARVPLRALWIPAIAAAGALVWLALPERPEQPVAAASAPTPSVDLVAELQRIGAEATTAERPTVADELFAVGGSCTRPSAHAQAEIRARVATWVDAHYRSEKANAADGLELAFGCVEGDGIVVDANVDRTAVGGDRLTTGRWWILRVRGDAIEKLAERTSTPKDHWMEWADEGTVHTLALADVDGDGRRDIVWSSTEHEGGAIRSGYAVSVRHAGEDRDRPIVSFDGILDVTSLRDKLVLGFSSSDPVVYRCVEGAQLTTCDALAELHRQEIARRYRAMTRADLPDREQLATDLAVLGVPRSARVRLLAAARPTTIHERAERDVLRFVGTFESPDDLGAVIGAPHPEAQAYFDELQRNIGDVPCKGGAPTDSERAAALRGVPSDSLETATVQRACDGYLWLVWDELPGGDGRREELLHLGGGVATRVVHWRGETDPTAPLVPTVEQRWYLHGETVVGMVVHDGELLAIADGRVVARERGTFDTYRYATRWADTSADLFVDWSTKTWWHATPTTLEPVKLAAIRVHEAQRAAIETLFAYRPGDAALEALEALHAPAALVEEVRQSSSIMSANDGSASGSGSSS